MGTAEALRQAGLEVSDIVAKIGDDDGVTAVELIESGKVQLVINSPRGRGPRADGAHIRKAAGERGIPLLTTASSGLALAKGLIDWSEHPLKVKSLQDFHIEMRTAVKPMSSRTSAQGADMLNPLATSVGNVNLKNP